MIKQIPEDFIVEEIPLFELKEKGDYTYFLLTKKEYNTENAIQIISRQLKIPRKKFGYAGTKDRNAITKQYCSVLGKIKDHDYVGFNAKVLGYGDKPISLGDLKGNKFIITLRNIDIKPKKTEFIINYFDDQRFGRKNLDIGLAILKKDFEKAASMMDHPEVHEHLHQSKNDFIGAIRKIHHKTLKFYVNAVQSFFWNEVTAKYVKAITKEFSEVDYKHGKFVISDKKIADIKIPLLCFDTEFENHEIERLYEKVLKKHGIELRNFVIRSIPDITPMGFSRNLIAKVKNMEIGKLEQDELNENMKKCIVKFELGKGSYATIVLRTSLKPS